jgi:hypothetical protein
MTPEAVVAVVAEAGVTLEATVDGLRYTAPGGLAPGLRQLIREHRTELLTFLAETATGPPAEVPLPRPPKCPRGKRRQEDDHGHRFETVSGGETCDGCGRSEWRKSPAELWLCRCGLYWTRNQARPDGWPERWPEPVPSPDGGCCRRGGRVYLRRGDVEECVACRPPDDPPGWTGKAPGKQADKQIERDGER